MRKKSSTVFTALTTCTEQMSEGEMTEEDAEEESGSSDLLSNGFTGISEWA